jgi:AcrR family transcriptional regulator
LTEVRTRTSSGRARIEQKERAILDAARAAFIERGFQGAKVADIAKAAGISEGSVYFYYPNKDELLHAVLAKFWADLTHGAAHSVDPAAGTFEQMASLARFHLDSVIRDFEFIDLQLALRGTRKALAASREQLRKYVSIFDDIIRRGVDRGVIKPDIELWLLRDIFYGTLDYASRTLIARAGRRNEAVDHVVNHLVAQIFALHGVAQRRVSNEPAKAASYDKVLDRLQSIADQLEAASSAQQRQSSNVAKKRLRSSG